MISGDFRSAVHSASAEPWRIDVVVYKMLMAQEPMASTMLMYATSALRHVPIGADDALTLADLVGWCWAARGISRTRLSLAGLAWAVVMRPRRAPRGNDKGVCFGWNDAWNCRCFGTWEAEFGPPTTLIRLGRTSRRAWMGPGEYGVDVGLYYDSNRRVQGEAA